ncbi:Hypothetical predicted protein [Pelobates cultripes]|uniref:Uncharacterized protein n=1 Tax=Pelobates cultripes TaxID=61616 RepID=A0AAD1R0S3_PELCU|nr:Hypothetical predicted protein [Pelobates cultripes]
MQKREKPDIEKLQRPDLLSGPQRAFPIWDATSRQSRGEPRAALQRSSPQPICRTLQQLYGYARAYLTDMLWLCGGLDDQTAQETDGASMG